MAKEEEVKEYSAERAREEFIVSVLGEVEGVKWPLFRPVNHLALEACSFLTSEQRLVVESRWGLNDGRKRKFREVGDILGLSAKSVSRLHRQAIARVQSPGVVSHLNHENIFTLGGFSYW